MTPVDVAARAARALKIKLPPPQRRVQEKLREGLTALEEETKNNIDLELNSVYNKSMKPIEFSKDVVAIGVFKAQAAAWLDHLRNSGHPVVITQNGKPAGILLSPAEFDRLQEKERFLESVAKGLADAEAGRVMDSGEVHRRLAAWREAKRAA